MDYKRPQAIRGIFFGMLINGPLPISIMPEAKRASPTRTPPESEIIWEIPPMPVPRHSHRKREIYGTLVLDIDGTITKPGSKYAIDQRAIDVMAKFLLKGGNIVFNSGATRYRIERTVLDPLYKRMEELDPKADVKEIFKSVYLQPENGSALLMNRRIYVQENMLEFSWTRIHQRDVLQKTELREFLETEFVNNPAYRGCFVADHLHPAEGLRREYIVSLKELKEGTPKDVIKVIEGLKGKHPEIDWTQTELKAARTTVDFVHKESGKSMSTDFLLTEVAGLDGPVIGIGDLGDEFASVVPTINVNQLKPNEYRVRGQPAMELKGGYELLPAGSYVSVGSGKGEKILDKGTGKEMMVVRDGSGAILYARAEPKADSSDGGGTTLVPSSQKEGHPLLIRDLKYWVDTATGKAVRGESKKALEGQAGRLKEVAVDDAGAGTAWIIEYLMDSGYFNKPDGYNGKNPSMK
jgi:hypothetical protein